MSHLYVVQIETLSYHQGKKRIIIYQELASGMASG